MSKHEQLVEEAKAAIMDVFEDTSVSQEKTREDLNALAQTILELKESLGQ